MKRKLLQRNGFTMFEMLCCILIVSVISLTLMYLLQAYNKSLTSEVNKVKEQHFISSAYQMFNEHPVNFVDYMHIYYDLNYDDTFYYYSDYLYYKYSIEKGTVNLDIFYKGELVEQWIRFIE